LRDLQVQMADRRGMKEAYQSALVNLFQED
jgi:hypothetical protein